MGRLQALARRALAAVGLVTASAARAQASRETAFRSGFERRYRELLARYDAAQTTGDNTKHWAAADCLSPNAANSPEVRQKLHNRARYECANNSCAHGIALTLANDCVGTGPRLQLLSPNEAANSLLEELFAEWAAEAQLAAKLKTMRLSKVWDGESFGLLTTNRRLTGPVKLDLRLVEAEQVADSSMLPDPTSVDGIQFDEWGNPVSYRVLRSHPGDLQFRGPSDFFASGVEPRAQATFRWSEHRDSASIRTRPAPDCSAPGCPAPSSRTGRSASCRAAAPSARAPAASSRRTRC